MPLKLRLPAWLDQTLAIKIGIYAAIALGLFLWWRAREARIAEENYVKGITGGVVRIEQKMDQQWDITLKKIQETQDAAKEERQEAARQVAIVDAKINTVLATVKKLTAVTLTIDERQKNYVEAHSVPPDQLDRALLEITRQIRELESQQQPDPVP